MNDRSPAKTIFIVITILGLLVSPTLAATGPGATLSGLIVASDSDGPLEVLLVDMTGEHLYRGPVDDSGRFEIADLPSATYRLAVRGDDGAYVGSAPLQLEAGQARQVRLALARAANDKKDKKDKKDGDLEDEDAEESRKKLLAGLGPWNNPLVATGIVIGGAVLVGWGIEKTTDDSTPVASASLP